MTAGDPVRSPGPSTRANDMDDGHDDGLTDVDPTESGNSDTVSRNSGSSSESGRHSDPDDDSDADDDSLTLDDRDRDDLGVVASEILDEEEAFAREDEIAREVEMRYYSSQGSQPTPTARVPPPAPTPYTSPPTLPAPSPASVASGAGSARDPVVIDLDSD